MSSTTESAAPLSTAASTESTEQATPVGPALFTAGGGFDSHEVLKPIWIGEDHLLHAGSWTAPVDVPSAEPFFVDTQASLELLEMRGSPLIVFIHPVEGTEDPANLYQVFAVDSTGLKLVYERTFEDFAPPNFSESGADYIESSSEACARWSPPDGPPVAIHQVFLETEGTEYWEEADRVETAELVVCNDLPG